MEVVATTATNGGVPSFHDHDVREWSRINSLTGVLERARLETDHWAANTNNSTHKYGKVVDSRARTDVDGALHQQARRQLEVFQSQIPGGHLQVIKTHSVSSSRWTNKTTLGDGANDISKDFESLQLPLNPLDLSSQKSKAIVGRSVGRRPPTRTRIKDDSSHNFTEVNNLTKNSYIAATNLQRVTRLCHQIHENALKQTFRKLPQKSAIHERKNGIGDVEIESLTSSNDCERTTRLNGHPRLSRTKSSSSEDLLISQKDKSNKSIEDLEDLEQLQNWRRTSKIRRSLQYPKQNKQPHSKPLDLPENSVNVRKIKEDLEKGRRLNTALRGNNVDIQALDQILQSISSSSSIHSDRTIENLDEEFANEEVEHKTQKRNSFVTVESLQEVKGRLRRTSSPDNDIYKFSEEIDTDDGIVTEDHSSSKQTENMIENDKYNDARSRVRSYVYGMEANLHKKPVLGTGSLESRSKLSNGISNNRNDDWYNRRKSYGFEQVQNQNQSMSSKSKTIVESSTDSGICRSNEIIVVPSVTKHNFDTDEYSSDMTSETEEKCNGHQKPRENGYSFGNVKKISSLFNREDHNPFSSKKAQDELTTAWSRRISLKDNDWLSNAGIKATTIKIPITSRAGHEWHDDPEKEIKRHSIAVDESKYVSQNHNSMHSRRTSLVINDKFLNSPFINEPIDFNKKSKKVEFCKTEVHFAAESGKVNIVETDEKPPPTQNFRRRRRNINSMTHLNDLNKNGLPVLHFGENHLEKTLLRMGNHANSTNYLGNHENGENMHANNVPRNTCQSLVTVNVDQNHVGIFDDERRYYLENDGIKGILKNKPIKPKPYHLGDPNPFRRHDDPQNWDKLLTPFDDESPIWKSTVTVSNTLYDSKTNSNRQQPSDVEHILNGKIPTNQPDLINNERHVFTNNYLNTKIASTSDNGMPSWSSVADRVKSMEDSQRTENKGYSTRVNFGQGEATVIENNRIPSEEHNHTSSHSIEHCTESKQIVNKGLVVRIGRENSTSKHMVCSKTTTNKNSANTTTTTKITIDLTPTGDNEKKFSSFPDTKYERSQNHSFKSTSLILNTIKCQNEPVKYNENMHQIPQHLEALKKLYEDNHSDSDVDKEVQLLTSKISARDNLEDDSVLSGSWSRMRAYKTIFEKNPKSQFMGNTESNSKINAQIEKENGNVKQYTELHSRTTNDDSKINIRQRNKFSPIVIRKQPIIVNKTELKTALVTDKLASPSLVGKNVSDTTMKSNIDHSEGQKQYSETSILERTARKFKNMDDTNNQNKYIKNEIVLRQPKKSEMSYFGVKQSSKPIERTKKPLVIEDAGLTNKPDLLPHYDKQSSPKTNIMNSSRLRSPVSSSSTSQSPLYENVTFPTKTKDKYDREFDRSILDELTKAADEILQAVNGYADEEMDSRQTTDDDDNNVSSKKINQMDVITERKFSKQEAISQSVNRLCTTKPKTKTPSSTSSVEFTTKYSKNGTSQNKATLGKTTTERNKSKTTSSETSSIKAATKARRLQRASSREALLQSHGSSSEDLPNSIEPVRKPRLIKKTKTTQLTMTNGIELSKKPVPISNVKRNDELKSKTDERIPGSLPEIRHKTAVSTIRSTAEKANREKSRPRNDESHKKLSSHKKDVSKGNNPSLKSRSVTSKEAVNHRTATANVKKHQRKEGSTRH